MSTTKVTIKLLEKLNNVLNNQLDASFMKRDKFIEHLISTQLDDLEEALKGRLLSDKAKKYISGHIKRAGTKTLNLVVQKEFAERLNQLVEKHNLMRDAVINRIIFFAIVGRKFYQKLGVNSNLGAVLCDSPYMLSLPLSPLQSVSEWLSDPLLFVKAAFELDLEANIFTYDFAGIRFQQINPLCFSCFITDENVPGTESYHERKDALSALLDSFLAEFEESKNVQ